MSEASPGPSQRPTLLGRNNILVLIAALATLGVGYLLLQGGGTTAAAVLLVIGYCILLPIAIAL